MPDPEQSDATSTRRWWSFFGFALALACLVNGAYPYLARIGLIERAAYEEYVSTYCALPRPIGFPTFTCSCMRDPQPTMSGVYPSPAYLYRAHGYRFPPKLAKEVLFLGLLLAPLLLGCWKSSMLRPPAPFLALAVVIGIGFIVSMVSSGLLFAVVSARAFEFVAIALVSAWLAPGLDQIGRWLGWLLLAELVLVGIELLFGMPTRVCPFAYRASASLVMPNSFGVFAAGALAFMIAFAPDLKYKAMWFGLALVLVASAGSGSGFVMLAGLAGWLLLARLPRRHAIAGIGVAVVSGIVLAFALPVLTARPDIYDSLFGNGGRVGKLFEVLAQNDPVSNVFGRGLGIGSNQTSILAILEPAPLEYALRNTGLFYADSTVTWLVMQLGIVGLAAFYGMLAWAFAVDRRARPFYFVCVLASLTINVPEAFPLNFLLGLALAHSLWQWRLRNGTGRVDEIA